MAVKATLLVTVLYVLIKLCLTQKSINTNKVLVSVYYETHCPDSKDFIKNQLFPTFMKIGPIMTIQLVPYGKASYVMKEGRIEFSCQHGEKECRGNMLQACAINIYNSTYKVLPLVYCMEKETAPEKALEKCADAEFLDANLISSCADSDLGKQYLLIMGELTKQLSPHLTFVPTITINGVRSGEALRDLRKSVCDAYKGPPFAGCNSSL